MLKTCNGHLANCHIKISHLGMRIAGNEYLLQVTQ